MRVHSSAALLAPRATATIAPFCVQLAGVQAPVLLPRGAAIDSKAAWGRYVKEVSARGIFDDAHKLAALRPGAEPPPPGGNRPTIGIVLSSPGAFTGELGVNTLIAYVRRMGAEPVLIPPCADLASDASRSASLAGLIGSLDGLIGPGGADVDPAIYSEKNTYSEQTNLPRDQFEADLARAAMRAELFMFGICRSHQLWNAATGGKLVQDVMFEGLSSRSQRQTDFGIAKDQPFLLTRAMGALIFENRVETTAGSTLAAQVGAATLLTNSFHHQAVKSPGAGLTVTGHVNDPATGQRTIEATEGRNVLTVQWHPELMPNDPAEERLLATSVRRAFVCFAMKQARSHDRAAFLRQPEAALRDALAELRIELDNSDWRFARAMLG